MVPIPVAYNDAASNSIAMNLLQLDSQTVLFETETKTETNPGSRLLGACGNHTDYPRPQAGTPWF